MADEQAHRAKMILKYPSLKKFEEQGDDYQESHDGREERLLEYLQAHPRLAEMRTDPTIALDAMDEYAAKTDFLIHIGSHKAGIVADLVAREKPTVVVELGGYMGYSAIQFALQARKLVGPTAHVWSLEFETRFADIMRQIFKLVGLEDAITVVAGAAADSLKELKQSGKIDHIDFFFLDHVEDLYEADLKIAVELGLVKKGALIVADNVVRPGAPQYREYVRSQPGFQSEGVRGLIIPGEFEDELEVTKVL